MLLKKSNAIDIDALLLLVFGMTLMVVKIIP